MPTKITANYLENDIDFVAHAAEIVAAERESLRQQQPDGMPIPIDIMDGFMDLNRSVTLARGADMAFQIYSQVNSLPGNISALPPQDKIAIYERALDTRIEFMRDFNACTTAALNNKQVIQLLADITHGTPHEVKQELVVKAKSKTAIATNATGAIAASILEKVSYGELEFERKGYGNWLQKKEKSLLAYFSDHFNDQIEPYFEASTTRFQPVFMATLHSQGIEVLKDPHTFARLVRPAIISVLEEQREQMRADAQKDVPPPTTGKGIIPLADDETSQTPPLDKLPPKT